MFKKLNTDTNDFDRIITKELQEDWADGGIWAYSFNLDRNCNDKILSYLGIYSFMDSNEYIIEMLNCEIPFITTFPTISRILLFPVTLMYGEITKNMWELHIRDMSQRTDEVKPSLLLRAEEFSIYTANVNRTNLDQTVVFPTLSDFFKWKEAQENDNKSNRILLQQDTSKK